MTKLTDQLADSARHQVAAEQRARGNAAPQPAEVDLHGHVEHRRDPAQDVQAAHVQRPADSPLGQSQFDTPVTSTTAHDTPVPASPLVGG